MSSPRTVHQHIEWNLSVIQASLGALEVCMQARPSTLFHPAQSRSWPQVFPNRWNANSFSAKLKESDAREGAGGDRSNTTVPHTSCGGGQRVSR